MLPTPKAFVSKIKEPKVKMLPLVQRPHRIWRDGWCTYTDGLTRNLELKWSVVGRMTRRRWRFLAAGKSVCRPSWLSANVFGAGSGRLVMWMQTRIF
ncbi:MAG: hypothetical protein M2R45_05333 [Verrucomicrobia subdivision 3 bacterium]|nr:hypothetical protein [Limisphaerales bacterium]MCS1414948.1 hypothetical protein [Limisphaerales bacterium]